MATNLVKNTNWEDEEGGTKGGTAGSLTPFRKIIPNNKEDEGGGDTGIGQLTPEESGRLANRRRQLEQAGHRRYARVNARFKPEVSNEPGMGPKSTLQQHPLLKTQRFAGVDKNMGVDPRYNPDAKREFENETREQEKEKQLRLGNMPSNSKRFDPRPSPA